MKIRVQNMGEVRDKIPLFRGLSNDQVQAIVDVGNLIELEPGRMLCHEGDASAAKIYHRLVDVLCRRLRESNVHLVRTQIKALGDLTLTI